MPENVTNELLYEVLKRVQSDLAEVKAMQGDHSRQFIRVREDVKSLRGLFVILLDLPRWAIEAA